MVRDKYGLIVEKHGNRYIGPNQLVHQTNQITLNNVAAMPCPAEMPRRGVSTGARAGGS